MVETELCKLALKYGTDKCPRIKHTYTPVYHEMFKDIRNDVKKVLEMGIESGASLRMWRDYFPNAQIYGADISKETLFEEERIETFLCDETKKRNIKRLVKQTGSDIDIFIDDGSHLWENQFFLAKTIIPLLKKDVIYIVEDVDRPNHVIDALPKYEVIIPYLPFREYGKVKNRRKIPKDRIMIIKNK